MTEFILVVFLIFFASWIGNEIGVIEGKQQGYEEYFKGNVECQKTIADTIICVNKGEKK